MSKLKCEIYRDSMQNYKKYAIPPAQLIIADVPYNVGKNFYGSNPMWYNGVDNKNGESKLAGKAAFNSDFNHVILKNMVVSSLKDVDFREMNVIPSIVVYEKPSDYPDKYVARVFDGAKPTNVIITRDSLEEIRYDIMLAGFGACVTRDLQDTQCIVETWL